MTLNESCREEDIPDSDGADWRTGGGVVGQKRKEDMADMKRDNQIDIRAVDE